MRDKLIYLRDKLNNNCIIYFFVGLSIILSFYPISSGSSIIGYFALIYVMFNYKDLSVNKIFIAVSLFSCWLLFSCLMTHNEFNNNDSRFWIKELRFFLMFLMLSIMLTKMSFKKFFDMYLITGAVFTFLGYVEVFSGNSLDSFFRIFRSHAKNLHLYFDDSIPRLLSISRNADPNFVAFIIAVLFISATIMVLSGWLKNKHISKLYIFLSLFFGIALLLTGSRGGVLVALFSLIFTSFIVAKTSYNTKIYKALIFIGGAFILILLCFNFLFPDNIFIIKLIHLFDKNIWKAGTSEGMRVEMLYLSFQLLKENVFFGVGPTGFQVASHLPEYYIKSLANSNFRDPHNFLATVGMLSGIPGMLLIVYIIYNGILSAIKSLKNEMTIKNLIILSWGLCFIGTIPFEYPLQDECRLVFLNIYFAVLTVYNKGMSNEKLY